jgi:Predicted phosphohydrolases
MKMKKSADLKISKAIQDDSQDTLKIWALSDIQPKDDEQKEEFRKAIQDMDENVSNVDFAIVAGDIINDADEEDFEWYLSTKRSSYIDKWYEIAGNHDLKLNRGEGYKRKIREDFHYSFTRGNILSYSCRMRLGVNANRNFR